MYCPINAFALKMSYGLFLPYKTEKNILLIKVYYNQKRPFFCEFGFSVFSNSYLLKRQSYFNLITIQPALDRFKGVVHPPPRSILSLRTATFRSTFNKHPESNKIPFHQVHSLLLLFTNVLLKQHNSSMEGWSITLSLAVC